MNPPEPTNVEEALLRFRERMKAYRSERDWSQAESAGRAGLDPSEWSRIEAGEVRPKLESALRIHYALELNSFEALFGELPIKAILHGASSGDAGSDE